MKAAFVCQARKAIVRFELLASIFIHTVVTDSIYARAGARTALADLCTSESITQHLTTRAGHWTVGCLAAACTELAYRAIGAATVNVALHLVT